MQINFTFVGLITSIRFGHRPIGGISKVQTVLAKSSLALRYALTLLSVEVNQSENSFHSRSLAMKSEFDELTPEERRQRIATILGNAIVRLHKSAALGGGDDGEEKKASGDSDAGQSKKVSASKS